MGMLLLLVAVAACGGRDPEELAAATPAAGLAPVDELVATLADEVTDLDNGRIKWETNWELCWAAYPGAQAYELETVTSEGTSPELRRQAERCRSVQVAAGENEKSLGLLQRDATIDLTAGQLGYRVRAVVDGNVATPWSPLFYVGQPTP